ncbi:MAG: hypothetical protein WBO46_12415 [Caldilineaceae bacterium]
MNESENKGKGYQNYNPVTVTVSESVGILVLGVLAVMLLFALLRSQSRHRKLLAQLAGLEVQTAEEQAQ